MNIWTLDFTTWGWLLVSSWVGAMENNPRATKALIVAGFVLSAVILVPLSFRFIDWISDRRKKSLIREAQSLQIKELLADFRAGVSRTDNRGREVLRRIQEGSFESALVDDDFKKWLEASVVRAEIRDQVKVILGDTIFTPAYFHCLVEELKGKLTRNNLLLEDFDLTEESLAEVVRENNITWCRRKAAKLAEEDRDLASRKTFLLEILEKDGLSLGSLDLDEEDAKALDS